MALQLSSQNIFQYLHDQALSDSDHATNDPSQLELKSAKNFNLLWNRPNADPWLIKQERFNRDGKVAGEFQVEWQMYELIDTFPELAHLKPKLPEVLHFNPEDAIWISTYLTHYQDLGEFYLKEHCYPIQVAIALGETVAAFHQATYQQEAYQQFLQSKASDLGATHAGKLSLGLERITPELYGQVPSDGLKFFALYQRFESLGDAIANLQQAYRPSCVTHNDLKINNILIHQDWDTLPHENSNADIIRVIDWERNGWGDPAYDLGTLIASYLQIWLSSMVVSQDIPLEESLKLASIPLEKLQPSVAQFLQRYLTQFPEILEQDSGVITRSIQYTGFVLIQQIQAQLQYEKMFGNIGICMLQVAKSLLSRPERSLVTVTGMDQATLLSTLDLPMASVS